MILATTKQGNEPLVPATAQGLCAVFGNLNLSSRI